MAHDDYDAREGWIPLEDGFYLEPDTACWALHVRREGAINPATQKPTLYRDDTYHANIRAALLFYCDQRLKDCGTVEQILAKLNELEAEIKAASDRIIAGVLA